MGIGEPEASSRNEGQRRVSSYIRKLQLEIRLGGFVLRGEIPCGETVPLTTVARKTGSDPRTLDRYWGFADGPSAEDFTYPLPADPNQVKTLGAGTAYRTTWMRRADGEIARIGGGPSSSAAIETKRRWTE